MKTTIGNLRIQTDSGDWDLRRTLEEYVEARQAKDRLQQEVSDEERALHEDRLRGFHERVTMKRNHEFYFAEFSRTKFQENQSTINNLMDRVRELQCEINYMHDSKEFQGRAESFHSSITFRRSQWISVISSSRWSRRIAGSRQKYAA